VKRLLSTEHFSVDGTLIDAWALMKSFRRKRRRDDPPPSTGRNASFPPCGLLFRIVGLLLDRVSRSRC
jgi:hypothetical protein